MFLTLIQKSTTVLLILQSILVSSVCRDTTWSLQTLAPKLNMLLTVLLMMPLPIRLSVSSVNKTTI